MSIALAVSGQNVALIVAGSLGLAWLAGIPRRLGEVGALAGIGGYVLAVGAQPSVVRAGVAGGLASLAWLTARQRDRWYFLLAGALVLLAWNPYSLLDAGFQLSFAAVAAIFTLYPRLDRRLEGYPLPRRLREAVALSTACGVATAPVLWLQFHALPLLSVPANALAFAVAAPLLGLGLGAAVLAPLWPAAAAAAAWCNGWCAAYLAGCARLVAAVPFARVSTSGGLAATALAAAALVALARLPRRRRLPAAVAVLLVASAFVLWRTWPRAPPPPVRGLRISFLDVGQGDSALLQVPEGAVLVDEGPPEAHVARQLRRLGVRRLSAIVLTHPQRDHIGGAAEVLRDERVDFVLDPRIPVPSRDESAALAAAAARRVPVVAARAGAVYRLGRLRLRVVWPDGGGPPQDDPNDHAVVLVASYGAVDALLTSDAESDVTGPLALPPVEILKVAHHGSADGGLPELLARLRPELAVISVGARNDYGHPTGSALAALAASPGLRLYRTDLDGRVVVDTDGAAISVRTER